MRHSPARHPPVPGAVQPVVVTVTREALGRTSSLVLTPAVVAHRGASGHRPEHTLDAYRTAIRMGVDDIELDLVATRDGVLVARHDLELSATTDVADRPDLAHLRRTLVVDGVAQTGWFVQDLTLAELKTLATRERMPGTRPANTAYDGAEGVPSLTEVLAMVGAESLRRGRPVGLLLELKHAAHHDAIGLPLDVPLLRVLARHGLDHAWARVGLMSFEPGILRRLAGRTRLPIIQLLDLGDELTTEALDAIDEYADGIGPHASLVLPRDRTGAVGEPSTPGPRRPPARADRARVDRPGREPLPAQQPQARRCSRRPRGHGRSRPRAAGGRRRRGHHRPPRGGARGAPRALSRG